MLKFKKGGGGGRGRGRERLLCSLHMIKDLVVLAS